MMVFSGIVSVAALFMTFFLAMLCRDERHDKSRRADALSNALGLRSRRSSARRPSVVKLATEPWGGGRSGAVLTMRSPRPAVSMTHKAANAGQPQAKAR